MDPSNTVLTMSCSFGCPDTACAPFRNYSTIVPLISCERDTTHYLNSLGVSLKRDVGGQAIVSEIELILNRAGMFNVEDKQIQCMTICPMYREQLTLVWPGRKQYTCA